MSRGIDIEALASALGDQLDATLPDGVEFCLVLLAAPDRADIRPAVAVVAVTDDPQRMAVAIAKAAHKLSAGESEPWTGAAPDDAGGPDADA